ncbi:MAG TPA: hypothetical protein VKU00_34345 [Chthonomonadaceae bacterium]|nr:hypothetical protein [Chthonomonadaceae bacterium]
MQTRCALCTIVNTVEPAGFYLDAAGMSSFWPGTPGSVPNVMLDTPRISDIVSFGATVYEAAQQILQGRARRAATLLMAITTRELQSHFTPDAAYVMLALLSLRAVAKEGGILVLPAEDWAAALQRIEARSGEPAARQAQAAMAFIEGRYPGVLVWETSCCV